MGGIFSRVLLNFTFTENNTTEEAPSKHVEEIPVHKEEHITTHMESIADDFMKHEAFTRTAEKYGLTDDFLTDDLPLEETGDDFTSDLEDDFTYENPTPFSDGIIRWKMGALIGSGSFGKVHLGVNLDTGEFLAVKQVELRPFQLVEQEVEVYSLQHEISVLKTLKHKNIVQYLGTSIENDTFNIFLEFVTGGSLASVIKKFGQLPESLVRLYTYQILEGLAYLHEHNILHRDIKGANILVSDKGVIKLADFGASKKLEGLFINAGIGEGINSLKGTTYWMAPEVIKQTGCDTKADIWSLACTVIEMFTGKPPWFDEFEEQVSAMFTIATSDKLPQIPNNLSAEAKDFLTLCFNRNSEERPSAVELLKHRWMQKPGDDTYDNDSSETTRTSESNSLNYSDSNSWN